MYFLQRLPYILGATAALAAGLLSYKQNIAQKDIYIRMAVSMSIFFVIGIFIRGTLISIRKEIEEKKAIEEQEELEMLKQQELEAAQAARANADNLKGDNIDYRIDDLSEQFTPLNVNKIHNARKNI